MDVAHFASTMIGRRQAVGVALFRPQRIVRRGSTSSVRYRRARMLLALAGGNRVTVIAHSVHKERARIRSEKGIR
ncbi:hypothetical protein [Streptomyces fodineus]|uniref:hypothetical protein n=1 Tax=Streptomyces fodineus TaxID=1904616 RepID=UPI0009A0D7C8|nr:hypothetical protein [Streptomyces fodineus]